jgi:hypothetical protein
LPGQIKGVDAISEEMRAVIEAEWPELVYKLPPQETARLMIVSLIV